MDKNPKQWVCAGNSLEEVVIIINGKKIPVDVSVAYHYRHVGNMVDVKEKFVEIFEFSWLETIQRKSSKFCSKLGSRGEKGEMTTCQDF